MSDGPLSERLAVRATPNQVSRWQAAAEKDRRKLADWMRVNLDDAAEYEENAAAQWASLRERLKDRRSK